MSDTKRYGQEPAACGDPSCCWLVECTEGEWVEWADYGRLQAQVKALKEALNEVRAHLVYYQQQPMFGNECDDSIQKALDEARAALALTEEPK